MSKEIIKNAWNIESHPTDSYIGPFTYLSHNFNAEETCTQLRKLYDEALAGNADSLCSLLSEAYSAGYETQTIK